MYGTLGVKKCEDPQKKTWAKCGRYSYLNIYGKNLRNRQKSCFFWYVDHDISKSIYDRDLHFFSFEDKKKTLGVRWEQKICIVNAWLSKNWFKKIFLDFCLFLENLRILKYFFLSKNSNGLAILYIRCIFNDFRSNLNAENISLSTVIHNFLLKFDKISNFLMFFCKTNQSILKKIY